MTALHRKRICAIVLAAAVIGGIVGNAPRAIETHAESDRIDVWLIGGQSNAVGYAQDSPDDADSRYTQGFENVLFWGDYECDASSPSRPPSQFVPVTTGLGKLYGNGTKCSGAELGIASALAESGGVNAVIKCAWGATFLYPDTTNAVSAKVGTWTPPSWLEANPSYKDSAGKIGACYAWFLETVQTGLQKLTALGYTPVIRGMWWMQGEADIISPAYTNAYRELLTALISDLRRDLSDLTGSDLKTMPFVIGKIFRNPDPAYRLSAVSENGVAAIRSIQQNVADNLFNVFTVDCAGLPQKDGWHFKADGQKWLGEQFVSAVLTNEGAYQVSVSGAPHISLSGGGVKQAGQTVVITCTPIRGYQVGKLVVREGEGEEREIALTDGRYTFTMPENNVCFAVTEEAQTAYRADYSVNDPGMGSVYISYPASSFKGWYEGESIQIGVLPKDGYMISSVTVNGVQTESAEKIGNGYSYTVTENADVHVAVTFCAVKEEDGREENGNGEKKDNDTLFIVVGSILIAAVVSSVVAVIFRKRKKRS